MTRDEAALLLANETNWPVNPANLLDAPPAVITRAYQGAVKRHHLNRGGEVAMLNALAEARDLLIDHRGSL